MGTHCLVDLLARDVGRLASDRTATQRHAANDQKSVESTHRAGRLPATNGETVKYQDAMKAVSDGKPVFSHIMRGAIVQAPGMPAAVFIPSAGSGPLLDQQISEHVATAEFEAADDWFVPDEDAANAAADRSIEAEIQAKDFSAPRVTPEDIDANIAHTEIVKHISPSGQVLRWAVLTTRSGFAVTGKPSCAVSSANDDPVRGETIAVVNARDELWALMGYELKCRLAREAAATEGGAA